MYQHENIQVLSERCLDTGVEFGSDMSAAGFNANELTFCIKQEPPTYKNALGY